MLAVTWLLMGIITEPALGQDPSPAAAAEARHRAVSGVCADQLLRYCPGGLDAVDSVRCLRPYSLDLPLPCRHAIQAELTAGRSH